MKNLSIITVGTPFLSYGETLLDAFAELIARNFWRFLFLLPLLGFLVLALSLGLESSMPAVATINWPLLKHFAIWLKSYPPASDWVAASTVGLALLIFGFIKLESFSSARRRAKAFNRIRAFTQNPVQKDALEKSSKADPEVDNSQKSAPAVAKSEQSVPTDSSKGNRLQQPEADAVPEAMLPVLQNTTSDNAVEENTDEKPDEKQPSLKSDDSSTRQNSSTRKNETGPIVDFGNLIARITVVFSPKDEAILGLRRASKLKSFPLAEPEIFKFLAYAIALVAFVVLLLIAFFFDRNVLGSELFGESALNLPALGWAISAAAFGAALLLVRSPAIVSWAFNKFVGGTVRVRALGNDVWARPIKRVTDSIPLLQPSLRWREMPRAADYAMGVSIDYHAQEAWQRAREILLIADFAGDTELKRSIERANIVDWSSLVHTTYFRVPLIAHLVAYLSIKTKFEGKLQDMPLVEPSDSRLGWRNYPADNRRHWVYHSEVEDEPSGSACPSINGEVQCRRLSENATFRGLSPEQRRALQSHLWTHLNKKLKAWRTFMEPVGEQKG